MPDVKFSNLYPYTDFHELNLDWVIKEVKFWSERVGKSIQKIELTGTVGLVDTYTITYSDGTTSTFDVTNGNGIASVAKTGTVGLVDTYTITFQDGGTTAFEVRNGTASIDPTLTLSDYAADAKATGDAIRDLNDETNLITYATVTSFTQGKFVSASASNIGQDWTTLLQNNSSSDYLPTAIDVSGHIGDTLRLIVNGHGSTSLRAMGFCDSSNIISSVFREQDLDYGTPVDGKYTVDFVITDTNFFFSFSRLGTYNPRDIEIRVIRDVFKNRVMDTAYSKNEIDQMFRNPIYVNGATGDDNNPGTGSAPLKTIQAAVNAGANTIYISPGLYSEEVTISHRNGLRILPRAYGTYTPATPDTPKIIIDGNDTLSTGLSITDSTNITVIGFEFIDFTSQGMYLGNSKDVTVTDCIAHGCWVGGFVLVNSCAVFYNCIAYSIGHTGVQHPDGFNIHGYGNTEFIDCVAHDCGDDGISHHDGCTGRISGGEFYNCGKGGVSSPTHGAYIDVDGVYSHDNVYGIYAQNDSNRTVKGRITNCVFKNNSSKDIYISDGELVGWNNIYDTKSVAAGSTFVEY